MMWARVDGLQDVEREHKPDPFGPGKSYIPKRDPKVGERERELEVKEGGCVWCHTQHNTWHIKKAQVTEQQLLVFLGTRRPQVSMIHTHTTHTGW